MGTYKVYWIKTYTTSGTVEVEADSFADAEAAVSMEIGDYTGSMQYQPQDDIIEAYPTTERLSLSDD
jgi:hypothetical protein